MRFPCALGEGLGVSSLWTVALRKVVCYGRTETGSRLEGIAQYRALDHRACYPDAHSKVVHQVDWLGAGICGGMPHVSREARPQVPDAECYDKKFTRLK